MSGYKIEAFYLGVIDDLDTFEGDFDTEKAGSLNGTTFGSRGDPLYQRTAELTLDDTDNDGSIRENDRGGPEEPLTHDGVSSGLDSVTQYNVLVSYADGTTAVTRMHLLQDGSGRSFLSPSASGSGDNDALDEKPIESITIQSVADDSSSEITANLASDAFAKQVDGTTGDDLVDAGYTDAYGDGVVDGGNGDEKSGDTLRLTPDVAWDDISLTDADPEGGYSGSFKMADGTVVKFKNIENIICFTPGTRILTEVGERPIETLQPGDRVVTRDSGLQPIRWIGTRTVPGKGRFAPVHVASSVLDSARSGLLVSPQHRLLFTGYQAELLFGEPEVLVPAKHLVDGLDVTRHKQEKVTYIHLMFDHHEIIYAEGIATESFHAGDIGLTALCEAAREELFALFPELRSAPRTMGDTARPCLRSYEAKLLRESFEGALQ